MCRFIVKFHMVSVLVGNMSSAQIHTNVNDELQSELKGTKLFMVQNILTLSTAFCAQHLHMQIRGNDSGVHLVCGCCK